MRRTALLLLVAALAAACDPASRSGSAPGNPAVETPAAESPEAGAEAATPGGPSAPAERPGGEHPRPPDTPQVPGPRAVVSRVVDGDTVEVALEERTVVVRLIGIDTPETVAPGQPVECFGREASAFTREALEGREVTLEFDVERIDPYGRTLAYLWAHGELFNRTLVARGFATVTTYPPNVRYVDHFVAAQREARRAGRGLWGAC